MKLNKLYLETIEHFEPEIQECLLREAPHGRLERNPLLHGWFADMGFENLGLPKDEFRKIMLAYAGSGVRVPNTEYRIRVMRSGTIGVERADGSEQAELPAYWREAIFMTDADGTPTWIGRRVRPDQLQPNIDRSKYRETAEGWEL